MFHRSERLLLRPAWPEDWQGVFGAIADEGVVRNLARAPWPYKPQHARDFVSREIDPRFPRCLVTRACDAAVVGCIGIDASDSGIELGYWIARQNWGCGYATEAVRSVISIAAMLGHQRLVASHFLDNPASGRVLSKAGFAPTGHVRMAHSCGRAEEAPVREYALEIAGKGGSGDAGMCAA